MYQSSLKIIKYRIQPYDNVWMLSNRFDTDINAIESVNPGTDLSSLRVGQIINICPGFVQCRANNLNLNNSDQSISRSQLDLLNRMRVLWEDSIMWMRMAIKSTVFNLPDMDFTVNRLFKIPQDFSAALNTIYGKEDINRMITLINNYVINTLEIIMALNAGDENTAQNAETKWKKNADELSKFMGSVNPNWSADEFKNMFYNQLNLTKLETNNLINKNYEASINNFDEIRNNALKLADMMAYGIIKQFPEKFQ